MKDSVRLKVVSFNLWVDTAQFADPSVWNFNQIFGFKSIGETGALITHVDVVDGGTFNSYLLTRKHCQQQKT